MDTVLVFHQYDFNLVYAKALVEDLSQSQMTITPAMGLENHPAFTLGHLVSGSALMAEDLGAELDMPEHWPELFLRKGPGDPRLPDPHTDLYPSKEALIRELERQHKRVKALVGQRSPEELSQPFAWRFNRYFPSLADLICFMCINHEAMHLGQLAAWRRAMDLPSALGKL